ncbi:MAG: hypothetical protein ACXAB9_11080 [Candidatus Thorarchaeota archaeon]|jgi:hypothetical protein
MGDGKLHVKSEREMKRLLQKQQRSRTDAEVPELEGAGKRLEKLEKLVAKQAKAIAGQEARIQKLMTWMIQEGGGK